MEWINQVADFLESSIQLYTNNPNSITFALTHNGETTGFVQPIYVKEGLIAAPLEKLASASVLTNAFGLPVYFVFEQDGELAMWEFASKQVTLLSTMQGIIEQSKIFRVPTQEVMQ